MLEGTPMKKGKMERTERVKDERRETEIELKG